jgi:hypothetical protein
VKLKLPKLTAEHILYGIATANALRLAWAYATADAGGNVVSLPGFFGLLLGATVSIGTAFISGKLGGRLTQGRKVLTWAAFVLVLVIEPIILAPITMSHMSTPMMALLGVWGSWVWAISLALVPSLVLAGVAVANGRLVEATAPKPLSEASESQSQGSARRAKKSKSQSLAACRYAGAGCEMKGSQNAMNAHARYCPFKPTISMPAYRTASRPIYAEEKVTKA